MSPNTAGCGRRQGSALRFARWCGANAALTAVLAGQDNLPIRAKAKRKIGLLGAEHQKERALTQNRGHFPRSCTEKAVSSRFGTSFPRPRTLRLIFCIFC